MEQRFYQVTNTARGVEGTLNEKIANLRSRKRKGETLLYIGGLLLLVGLFLGLTLMPPFNEYASPELFRTLGPSYFIIFALTFIVGVTFAAIGDEIRRNAAHLIEAYGRQREKRCPNCGAQIGISDTYCGQCGSKIS